MQWQEEWRERQWCWQCWGDWPSCDEGDKVEIKDCNASISSQRWTYQPVTDGFGKLSPLMNQTLCLERLANNETSFRLKPCTDTRRQLISGWNASPKFELQAYGQGQGDRCLTQEHDPKNFEEIISEKCYKARADFTNYWGIHNAVGVYSSESFQHRSDHTCIIDLDLMDNIAIRVGVPFQSPDHPNIFLQQMPNGNLIVRDGEKVLWETGVNKTIGKYYTKLQGDGNMMTYRGEPGDVDENDHERVWKSGSSAGSKNNYFLGMDCDGRYVALFSGRPSSLDDIIWSDSTMFPSGTVLSNAAWEYDNPPPSSSPSQSPWPSLSPSVGPSFEPTLNPSTIPSLEPSSNPTVWTPPTMSPSSDPSHWPTHLPTRSTPSPQEPTSWPTAWKWPTKPPITSCRPYFLGLRRMESIREDWVFRSPDDDTLLLEQWNTGNLAIRDGNTIIWESQTYNAPGTWFTKLQDDGNLVTCPGLPEAPTGPTIWKSDSFSPLGDFFLGLDCMRYNVAIYGGTPEYPDGSIIWQSPTYNRR